MMGRRIESIVVQKILIALMSTSLAACGNSGGGSASSPAAAPAPAAIAVANADFEKPLDGEDVAGWTLLQHAGVPSYKIGLDHDGAGQGQTSFRIERTHPQYYGSITQHIALKPYAGKTVRLSALTKTEGVGPAGWKLFIDAKVPHGLAYSSGQSGTSGWQTQSLDFKVPDQVGEVTIGASLLDAGTAWLDDVHIHVVD